MNAKTIIVTLLLCCVSLFVGARIENLRLKQVGTTEGASNTAVKTKPTLRDQATERTLAAQQRRVAELEQQLAQLKSAPQTAPDDTLTEVSAPEPSPREARGERGRQSWEERMQRMQEEEPERYAEMQKRRTEFRQQAEQRIRDRIDFLDAVDISNMTPEQRANHQKLLDTVARATELGAQMMQSGFGRGEEQRELRQELGETMGSLNELYAGERQYLLEATAKAAGYSGDDVAAFSQHIQAIFDNTTMPGGMMGGMMGGRGRTGGRRPPTR